MRQVERKSRIPARDPSAGIPQSEDDVMSTVNVFYFETYDFEKDQVVRSKRPATQDFIERYGFHRIDEDVRAVDTAELDAYGLLAGDS